jgi:sugar lactone lactonase YvrE
MPPRANAFSHQRAAVSSAALSALLLSACSAPGGPPATPFTASSAANSVQAAATKHLYVVNESAVTVYALGSTALVREISKISPTAIAFDKSGRLYVANVASVPKNQFGDVEIFPPQSSVPKIQITSGIHFPNALALNGSGDIFVSNYYKQDSVYAPGGASLRYQIPNLFSIALTLDKSGNLYIAENQGPYGGGGGRVQVYAQSTGKLLRGITAGIDEPIALALDRSNNLYVANAGNVTVYAPGSGTVLRTITGLRAPHALAFDGSGNLHVADDVASTVTVYAPGSTKPSRTIRTGVNRPMALAFDAAGNLFVGNKSSVTVYAAHTYALQRTITSGVKLPVALVFGP